MLSLSEMLVGSGRDAYKSKRCKCNTLIWMYIPCILGRINKAMPIYESLCSENHISFTFSAIPMTDFRLKTFKFVPSKINSKLVSWCWMMICTYFHDKHKSFVLLNSSDKYHCILTGFKKKTFPISHLSGILGIVTCLSWCTGWFTSGIQCKILQHGEIAGEHHPTVITLGSIPLKLSGKCIHMLHTLDGWVKKMHHF